MALKVILYGTSWCSDCVRSKRVLKLAHVEYAEIDIEEVANAEDAMRVLNGGSGKVPTILIESEGRRDILVEPSDPDLKSALVAHLTVQETVEQTT
jgi:mycoredoxin